jgi:hypothetical protein
MSLDEIKNVASRAQARYHAATENCPMAKPSGIIAIF